ncbi:DUF5009 domain-containing protein [Candidatus Sumerlaeota bacterium]|nr:DUF5009 domain-containing protein [Candidatus Sumerlaeota bacterium]
MTILQATDSPQTPRVASIDAFRGFVIMTMVFVNSVAEKKGIPAWMQHMPPGVEGMTFVDVVFSAFLFIVGMVIPVAFERRLGRGDSVAALLLHTVLRAAGLIAVGVLLVNSGGVSPERTGLNANQWQLLVYGGIMLAFLETRKFPRMRAMIVRGAGVGILLIAAMIYHDKDGGTLRTSWWGILGLIGWAYLAGVVCYALCRRSTTALLGCMALLVVVYESGIKGGLSVLEPVMRHVYIPQVIGSHGAIVVAGIMAGVWVMDALLSHRDKFLRFVVFGLGLLAAGNLLRVVHGFDKINATDSWALASAGWSLLTFAVFYGLMDWRGWHRWAAFLRPAGANPLMAYILPSILIYGLIELGLGVVFSLGKVGAAAIVQALVLSAVVLALTAVLNRAKVLLRF